VKLLLTGATGQVGDFLLRRMSKMEVSTIAVSRYAQASRFDEQWIVCDLLHDDPFARAGAVDAWIHAGLLTLTLPWLESAARAGVKRLISFSSTSVFTKLNSSSNTERTLIGSIREAEDVIVGQCKGLGIHWTVFRPTLIYGRGTDQNISFIIHMIRRFGFFPIVGDGSALRQPVHAEDLAVACIAALNHEQTINKAYNLSGGEVLSYQDVVKRIFHTLDCPCRIIHLPSPIFKSAISVLKCFSSRYAFIQTSMVDRMNMDMVFDHMDATHDFGYDPRPFQP